MYTKFSDNHYTSGSVIKWIRVILLYIILGGVILLCTEKVWVPKLVRHVLKNDPNVLLVGDIDIESPDFFGTI